MLQIAPLTELDAVNEILSVIGDSPINTLENMTDVDAINAHKILSNINRQFQSRGWSFNKQDTYKLTPDAYTNKIVWFDNIIFIKGLNGEKLINKDGYVYDLIGQTNIFKKTIEVEIVLLVPFEEMPEQARSLIVAKASQTFCARFLGDELMTKQLNQSVQEAWMYLQEYELDQNDYNLMQNADITKITQR